MELTKSVEVGQGGRIELILPELSPGQRVDVRITTQEKRVGKKTEFGLLKGKIRIHDDFDDPIPGFEEYT